MEMNIHKRGVHNIYLRVYSRIYYDNIPMRLRRIIKKDIIYTSKCIRIICGNRFENLGRKIDWCSTSGFTRVPIFRLIHYIFTSACGLNGGLDPMSNESGRTRQYNSTIIGSRYKHIAL